MDDDLTTLQGMIMLQAAYPRMEFGEESLRVYEMVLADIAPPLLRTAVLRHISTSKWFPTIAELRQAAAEIVLQTDGQLTGPEAWGMVQREVRLVGHWRKPRLGPMVRRAVEAIGGWRQLCLSENSTADRARFIEAYTILRKREADRVQALPQVTGAQEGLAEGREKVDTAVAGLLARMNGSSGGA
jgi:hypothetical protein